MLQVMRSLSTTLSSVSTLVESAASKLQEEVATNAQQSALANLPNEVLANVFEAAYDLRGRERNDFSRRIVRVCRKYREIARKLPRLWSYFVFGERLSDDMDLFFELSRDYGIVVEIHCDSFKSLEELKAIMRRLEPHIAHIKEFTLHARHDELPYLYVKNFLEFLREQYAGVELRALDTLRLFYWEPSWTIGHFSPSAGQLMVEERQKMFFKTWKTPLLRELEISNHIPVQFDYDAIPISRLRLVFGSPLGIDRDESWTTEPLHYSSGTWNVVAIVDFLSHCRNIEELSITLGGISLFREGVAKFVDLLDVSKLSLAIDLCGVPTWKTLMSVLHLQNVKQLDLVLNITGRFDEDYRGWFEPFSNGSYWENVVDVSLDVIMYDQEPSTGTGTDTDTFLNAFPHLQKLKLKGSGIPLPTQLIGLDELDTIRIEESSRLDPVFLGTLLLKNEWDPLHGYKPVRKIELVDCERVDEAELRQRLYKGMSLVWRNRFGVRWISFTKGSFLK